jgi:RNA polymerase sigma factor (TIGR02999 family)
MADVTRILEAAATGDAKAASDLLPLVYDELRKLAAARMTAVAPGHTLDATALVHEVYLRLTGAHSFESRSHFMRVAAEAMRRILVDHAVPDPPTSGVADGDGCRWTPLSAGRSLPSTC